jgi:hypothetical protein
MHAMCNDIGGAFLGLFVAADGAVVVTGGMVTVTGT